MGKMLDKRIVQMKKTVEEIEVQINGARIFGKKQIRFSCPRESVVYGNVCDYFENKGYRLIERSDGTGEDIVWDDEKDSESNSTSTNQKGKHGCV